jgi:thiol-disulfide isomerase/thioredoxin
MKDNQYVRMHANILRTLSSFVFAFLLCAQTTYAVEEMRGLAVPQKDTSAPATELEQTITPTYELVLHLFYSTTCPHCRTQLRFLEKMEDKYPELEIRRYILPSQENSAILDVFLEKYDATRFRGNVPLTFIGPYVFMGYDSDKGRGAEIEQAIVEVIEKSRAQQDSDQDGTSTTDLVEGGDTGSLVGGTTIRVPFLGEIDPKDYSLPLFAILLGFLDGFNVCSLGALVLILGLTLRLQSRRAIALLGGSFIVTTALVYGGLIVLWHQLVTYVGSYLNWMTVLVGLLSLFGGLYFFREYLRMRTQGAVCQFSESKWIQRMTDYTGKAFEHRGRLLGLFGAVIAFATVVAIVEFPCSAAVPVIFASILADMGLSTAHSLGYISLFVLFYMLDELVIFGIAVYKLKIWMTNGSFTKWAVLGEAILLIAIGVYYLGTLSGLF